MTEDSPVDHYASLVTEIEVALPLLRNSVARGEVPHGGLSASLLAIRSLQTLCVAAMEADDLAFREAIDACKDDDHVG